MGKLRPREERSPGHDPRPPLPVPFEFWKLSVEKEFPSWPPPVPPSYQEALPPPTMALQLCLCWELICKAPRGPWHSGAARAGSRAILTGLACPALTLHPPATAVLPAVHLRPPASVHLCVQQTLECLLGVSQQAGTRTQQRASRAYCSL